MKFLESEWLSMLFSVIASILIAYGTNWQIGLGVFLLTILVSRIESRSEKRMRTHEVQNEITMELLKQIRDNR